MMSSSKGVGVCELVDVMWVLGVWGSMGERYVTPVLQMAFEALRGVQVGRG